MKTVVDAAVQISNFLEHFPSLMKVILSFLQTYHVNTVCMFPTEARCLFCSYVMLTLLNERTEILLFASRFQKNDVFNFKMYLSMILYTQ